ncbi:endonuclease domain-containing protein [Sphingomonas sp. Ant H11]|uniref:endonuclease domain-containing protein n=1 Tax=Sphingomonas sp. Ant H11 TaxID=1564113 RepID=UPI0009DEE544
MSLSPQDYDRRTDSPPFRGGAGGWGLSAEYLAALQKRAGEMRRNPTEPEKRLWRALSNGQANGHKFRRQAVIGRYIADFVCPQKALIVEVDGDTHDEAKDRLRDDVLAGLGFRVLRVSNHDVMAKLEGVFDAVVIALAQASDRWERPHPNPSPEGEGLDAVEAQKLLGISLEGAVG